MWTKKEKVHSGPKKNLYVRRLLKLQSALSEVVLHASTPPKVEAVRRKVLALKWRPWKLLLHDLNSLHVQVKEELESVIQKQHETLISVLLAEVAISPLLWRLSLHDPSLSMWSYVDDLNLCADSVPKLLEAWAYIQEFAVDFCLSIATHKCSVWTISKSQRDEAQRETGLEITDTFQALGGEWALTKSAKLTYLKEMKRLQECMKRLERARCLPIKRGKLVAVVSVGCLSLLDYINTPSHLRYKQVAGAVKACFKASTGAPEVLFNVLTPEWVLRVSGRSSGRLGVSARLARRWDIEVTPRRLLAC